MKLAFVLPLLLFIVKCYAQSVSYTYDNANRLKQIISSIDITTYEYDPNGNRISTTITPRVLPVQLLSFNAVKQGSQALLTWATIQENNSAKFDIEHSIDGRNFQSFIAVPAKGLQTKANYSTLHCCPISGINYYRLKMIDKDGKYVYSEVKQVTFENPFAIKIYPNPLSQKNALTVTFSKALDSDAQTYIYTTTGIKVITTFTKGQTSYSINLPPLASGTYFIVVNTREKLYQSTFVKQ